MNATPATPVQRCPPLLAVARRAGRSVERMSLKLMPSPTLEVPDTTGPEIPSTPEPPSTPPSEPPTTPAPSEPADPIDPTPTPEVPDPEPEHEVPDSTD